MTEETITVATTDPDPILTELKEKLPDDLLALLDRRDAAAQLLSLLPTRISPEEVTHERTNLARAWELTGLFFLARGRPYEALPIFAAYYEHILHAQERIGKRVHKGTPLVWISECYKQMGCRVLVKRYLMLTLCEDAVTTQGNVSPEATGAYFRLVWLHGLSDLDFRTYVKCFHALSVQNPQEAVYPEWLLQESDQDWVNEFPTAVEAAIYKANTLFIRHLLSQLGEGSGKTLERLADYILSCMPGCRTTRRRRSGSTDYDLVCSVEGADLDFRSELGRYFVCECKDWQARADFTTFAKFCRVLDSTKSRFGILFSKNGISGQGKTKDAEREQLKIYHDRGIIIVVVDENDLKYVADGGNFISLLRSKYEKVRLDLVGDGRIETS